MKDMTMIRYAIDPDAKVAKPNETASQAKAGAISEENRTPDTKTGASANTEAPEKAGSIAEENQKTAATKPAAKGRKASAKRAVSNDDDKKLL